MRARVLAGLWERQVRRLAFQFALAWGAATYVAAKAVGTAVDVTTAAVSVTAHGAGAVVGVVTGGDDCDDDDSDNEDCE